MTVLSRGHVTGTSWALCHLNISLLTSFLSSWTKKHGCRNSKKKKLQRSLIFEQKSKKLLFPFDLKSLKLSTNQFNQVTMIYKAIMLPTMSIISPQFVAT